MMKILLITPFFPYSNARHGGGKVIYEIINALSQNKHEIYLLSRIEPGQMEFVNETKRLCPQIELLLFKTPSHQNIVSILRIIISYLRLGLKANRLIKNKNFDIVQVEYVEVGLFMTRKTKGPVVLHSHDVITKPAKRRYLAAEGIYKKAGKYIRWKIASRLEKYVIGKFDMIFTLSRQDRELLLEMNSGLSVGVLPHPVKESQSTGYVREPKTLLFAGAMNRAVNIEGMLYFFDKIWPIIRQEIPNVRLYIVGNDPDSRIFSLQNMDKNILVTGFVEKLEPYYLKSSVFVSPLLIGGGLIIKNLEAMSMGLPVVTTTIGNEGIEAIPDRDILIADTPKDFAARTISLLNDADKWDRISKNGRIFVLKHFSMQALMEGLDCHYKTLAGN